MAYKRIMVAIDDSETSNRAFSEAILLAQELRATLKIIYVVDEFVVVSEGVPFDFKTYEASIRQHGLSLLNKMQEGAHKAGIASVEVALVENIEHSVRISEIIIQETINWHADLLVIGTHGRRGFSRFILGSVAEGVIRLATIPVLLIRDGAT